MIVIFEDNKEDIISEFFRKAYQTSVSDKFVYAEGNANINDKAEYYLSTTNDIVVAFLDLVPGNRDIIKIYYKLKQTSSRYDERLIVMPIVCSEYYLVCSLYGTQVLNVDTDIDICVNREYYKNANIMQIPEVQSYCKNFEKYCKIILMRKTRDCACHSGKTTKQNYGYYYLKDCLCSFSEMKCVPELVVDKAIRFIKCLPCIPSGSLIKQVRQLTVDELWDIHRELVKNFNDMTIRYMQLDTLNTNKYKTISPYK